MDKEALRKLLLVTQKRFSQTLSEKEKVTKQTNFFKICLFCKLEEDVYVYIQ
jgi:hypothetical protein